MTEQEKTLVDFLNETYESAARFARSGRRPPPSAGSFWLNTHWAGPATSLLSFGLRPRRRKECIRRSARFPSTVRPARAGDKGLP